MPAISVGSVAVDVVPSVKNFARDIRRQVVPEATKIGEEIGRKIGDGISRGVGDPLSGPLEESSRRQQSKAPRQGDEVAGAFARGFAQRLKAAFASLPKANIDADSSPADRKIAELRARMEALSTKTIGVDLDAGAALAEIAAIRQELGLLGNSESIQVRVDAGAAEAQLAAIQAEVSRLDGETANVHVNADVSGALAGIGSVGIALAGLAAIPVGASIGAGLLGLAPALGAAGAGFAGLAAVAIPALGHIHDALKAQTQATQQSAAGAGQAQARALAEAGAQRQLAAAVRNAGYAHQQALDQVRNAEQQYHQALVAEADAQRALTQARAQARRQIEDLKNQLIDTGLAVEEDRLTVEQSQETWQRLAAAAKTAAAAVVTAQGELAKAQAAQRAVLGDPAATDTAKAQAAANVTAAQAAVKSAQDQQKAADLAAKQAEINYRQSVQRLKEEQLQLRRLQADEKAAAKAGVEGSDQVRQARERLTQANQQTANAELALQRARQNVARVDQQSADQIAAARQAMAQASLQGATANTKLATTMAKLSPAAKKLMRDWVGLKTAFTAWATSLEPAVLPLFSKGINLIKASLPALTPLVTGAAKAVGGLLDDIGNAAKSPFWTDFRKNLIGLVPKAITGLGHSIGNVITGIAGIINAFLPAAPGILSWLTRITEEFANWGKGLGGSNQFSQFMTFAQKNGPQVADAIAQIALAVGHVVSSLAGLGPLALGGFVGLARAVSGLSPGQIQALAIAFLAVRTSMIAFKSVEAVGGQIALFGKALSTGGREGPIFYRGVTLAGRGVASVARSAASGAAALGRYAKSLAVAAGKATASAFLSTGRAIGTAAGAAWKGVTALGSLAATYVRVTAAAVANAARTLAVAVAQKTVRAATIAWTAVQWLLNAALSANPIGLVALALGVLIGAIVLAWKRSETFRTIVIGVFNKVRNVTATVISFVISLFLNFAEILVKGAAKAFGWVPGLGGKLKGAAKAIENFKNDANAAIDKIRPHKDVKVNVYADGKFRKASQGDAIRASKATGGPIPASLAMGSGGPTEDDVPIWASVGEHMWTAKEVQAVGGHGAMYRLRTAALTGQIQGLATGGAVGLTARVPTDKKTRAIVDKYGYEHQRLTKAGQAAFEEALSLAQVWKKYATRGGSVVAAARSQIGLPYCVPLRTKVLTRRGWLSYDEVRPGDETLGYNPETGKNEWTVIREVVRFDDAEIVRLGGERWSVECTPGHRWLTRTDKVTEPRMRTTAELGWHHLVLSAEADTGDGRPITDREAAILGWLSSDGNVRQREGKGIEAVIWQSKPDRVAELRDLLDGIASERTEQPKGNRQRRHIFHIPADYARDLLARAGGHPHTDAPTIVLGMSPSQRDAWLASVIAADGSMSSPKHTVIYACEGPVRDAIKLAIYLSGHRPSESKLSGKDQWSPCWAHGICSPQYRPLRRGTRTDAGRADVWCVVTDLGSWTAEQDGQVFLTGNSWGGGGRNGPSFGIGRGAGTYGFDCSGLSEFAWWQGRHVEIGGTTGPQHLMSRRIAGPVPGALGFPHLSHVMIASNRPGYVIQAPHTGGHVEEVRRTASDWRWPKGASTTAGLARGGPVLPGEVNLARKFDHPITKKLAVEAKVLQLAGDPSGILPVGEWRRYDSGGYLPSGPSLVYNGTGQPEPVLTSRQWDAVTSGASGGHSGDTYNFYPRTLDMTVRDLDALQRRQEARARVGRPR